MKFLVQSSSHFNAFCFNKNICLIKCTQVCYALDKPCDTLWN